MRHPFATNNDLELIAQLHGQGFKHPTLQHCREQVYALSYATGIDPVTILNMPYVIFCEWAAYTTGRLKSKT